METQGLFIALKRSASYPVKEGTRVGSFNDVSGRKDQSMRTVANWSVIKEYLKYTA